MNRSGSLLAALGVALIVAAVMVEVMAINYDVLNPSGGGVHLGRLADRHHLGMLAAAAFVGGIVALASAGICRTIIAATTRDTAANMALPVSGASRRVLFVSAGPEKAFD